jgi:pimeloyl-ACP methyl ester carboxylesterase
MPTHLPNPRLRNTMPRKLKIHSHPSAMPTNRPPLLFVHGGYTHSGIWQRHFIPFLCARGYDCHALDLSGHGLSGGRTHLHQYGLDDYADDLAQAVAQTPGVPILIGHSMATVVITRYLSREGARASAVALLSPVPPSGTAGCAARFAVLEPGFFSELPNAIAGTPTAATLSVMARVYFSPDMRPEETEAFFPLIAEESAYAVAQLATLPFSAFTRRPAIPALVMGGSHDAVFPAPLLHFSDVLWRAKTIVVDRAGHMLMLDPQWPTAATALADWLDGLHARSPAASARRAETSRPGLAVANEP